MALSDPVPLDQTNNCVAGYHVGRAMNTRADRLQFVPKVPVAWIVQLYRRDAWQLQDEVVLNKVGGRLLARCLDVRMVSDERVACRCARLSFDASCDLIKFRDQYERSAEIASAAELHLRLLKES